MFDCPGPPVRKKTGSLASSDLARMRVTGSAISLDSGSARVSGTTSVPQSAGELPFLVAYSHGSRIRSPALAPSGTVTGPAAGAKRTYTRPTTQHCDERQRDDFR